jgi:hypothetical protein
MNCQEKDRVKGLVAARWRITRSRSAHFCGGLRRGPAADRGTAAGVLVSRPSRLGKLMFALADSRPVAVFLSDY